MASTLPTPSDCCGICDCNVVEITLPCVPTAGTGFITVANTSALRLVLANQRSPYMAVRVLTDTGVPGDGSGYDSVWYPDDLTPDNPIISVRPADIVDDSIVGRFLQFL